MKLRTEIYATLAPESRIRLAEAEERARARLESIGHLNDARDRVAARGYAAAAFLREIGFDAIAADTE